MTPTLMGRLQTRLFLVLTVGLGWTLLITPPLPRGSARLDEAYEITIEALVWVLLLGLVLWEPLYHLLQQLRWEKDWPTGIGLVTGLTEGALVYVAVSAGRDVSTSAFIIHFGTTWILIWAAVHGPLRIVLLRWRYRGGRII